MKLGRERPGLADRPLGAGLHPTSRGRPGSLSPKVTSYQCPLLTPYGIRRDYFLPSVIRHRWLESHLPSVLRLPTVTLRISQADSRHFQASSASFGAILGFSLGFINLKTRTEILSSNSGALNGQGSSAQRQQFTVAKEAPRIRKAPGPLQNSLGEE